MPSKKRSKKKASKAGYLVLAAIGITGVGALARYVKAAHADTVPPAEHRVEHSAARVQDRSLPSVRPRREAKAPAGQTVYVYTPIWNKESLKFARKSIEVPDDSDPKVFAINLFLQNTRVAPPQARLLSVDIRHGVASLFFTADMRQTYGTDDESMLLNGILSTMGQFPEVEKVDFYADGKQIDTFGNVELTEPQPVIRNGREADATRSEASQP